MVATLVDDPDAGRFDTRVLVRVDSFDGRAAGGRRVLVTGSGDVAGQLRILSAGESVVLRGWCTELEGFDLRWRWKHAVGEVHATEIVGVGPARAPLDRAANGLRRLVLAGSTHLQPVDRALLAGFLLGDTRGVPPELTEQFRAAGLTHLTAVSGENVAFVMALFAPLLRRSGLRGRVVLALVVLVCFGTMTRWEPSVLRAIAMATVALLAGALGTADHRPARPRARGDRAAARRSVPRAPGGVPPVVRREPRHRAVLATDHRRGCAVRCGCARCSGSPPPRRSAWRRC